tara:strand:- start:2177 stop:3589 length:1413 start_codon:yes stop_codon:yes gene_type:complete
MPDQDKVKNFSVQQHSAFGMGLNGQSTQQISQVDTIQNNNRHYFVSTNRSLLSYMYINYGLVQVLIDQPIDDAFRGGVEIKSDELTQDDLTKIYGYMKESETIKKVKQLAKWTRLFGGGAMVINTDGKADEPLDIEKLNKDSKLEFYPADLWELSIRNALPYGERKPYEDIPAVAMDGEEFFFYGHTLNNTRVIKTANKEAPAFLRPLLRGWGMSEVERMIRELNTYLKNSTLVFELLDEAKVDVMKIEGFNTAMDDSIGTSFMTQRIQTALSIKNFQNALVMDKEDDFEQKQLSFGGLSDMAQENRIGIASALRMPLTKIFGLSSAGFSSGEDEIENYNSMIESEIRGEFDKPLMEIVKLICKKELGFIPEDLEIIYKPLRILKTTEEQEVKDRELKRILDLFDRGIIKAEQVEELVNIANITGHEIKAEKEPMPPMMQPTLSLKDEEIEEKKQENIKNSKKFFKWRKN